MLKRNKGLTLQNKLKIKKNNPILTFTAKNTESDEIIVLTGAIGKGKIKVKALNKYLLNLSDFLKRLG
ncbi:MAG: hypothetical protein A2539_01310 [Elusimicrobia bacterium RIFOXYD2_FULL_34_15]|nr:MAG: hypothetical protein A2539_01310 [Elusimicrobia bacterium RIFOXYD2_FULL_34_15]